jgi:hypothetical protein
LSLTRRGLWTIRAWSQPEAIRARSSVSVTSCAFIVPFAKDVNAGASNYAQSWVRWEL